MGNSDKPIQNHTSWRLLKAESRGLLIPLPGGCSSHWVSVQTSRASSEEQCEYGQKLQTGLLSGGPVFTTN